MGKPDVENIYLLTSPEGIFRLDIPNISPFRLDTPDGYKYMLDSGAAMSVAPYAAFKNVKLERPQKEIYKLQSATGKRIPIYGVKDVPFMFGKRIVFIKVIICD